MKPPGCILGTILMGSTLSVRHELTLLPIALQHSSQARLSAWH